MSEVGLICGTGLYEGLNRLKSTVSKIKTPYGTVEYQKCFLDDTFLYSISRHGRLAVPPHRVNYKANIFALKQLGVKKIIATSAVGLISKQFAIGTFILPDQLIDFTRTVYTFYENSAVHVDLTEPFSAELRSVIEKSAKKHKIRISTNATYICVSGPAFETAAEIKMYSKMGADIVGMTVAPECKLAREVEITYQPICMAVNYAAGIAKKVSHEDSIRVVHQLEDDLYKIISSAVKLL